MIFFHLKNCLLLYFSMPQSAAFSPQRASFLFHACVLFFYGTAAFSFLFLKHRRHFSQLSLAVFCAFIQLYLTLRTEFSLNSIQNIRFFVRHFLFLRFRSCAGQKEMQQSPAGSAPVRGLQFIRRFPGPAARSCCP